MMKTTIKLFSALVLSVGFAACGGEPLAENQSVDENGDVQSVESVTQALSSGRCEQNPATHLLTGYCVANAPVCTKKFVIPACQAGASGGGGAYLSCGFNVSGRGCSF